MLSNNNTKPITSYFPNLHANITASFVYLFTITLLLQIILLICYWHKPISFNTVASCVYLHILCMIISWGVIVSNSSIVYRLLPYSHSINKTIHATLNTLVVVGISIGLAAIVIHIDKRAHTPHFYTLHSWIGITTISFAALQYLIGFVSFLLPVFSLYLRKQIVLIHKYLGQLIYISACISMISGLQLEETFSQLRVSLPYFVSEGLIYKTIATNVFILLPLVLYTTQSQYRTTDTEQNIEQVIGKQTRQNIQSTSTTVRHEPIRVSYEQQQQQHTTSYDTAVTRSQQQQQQQPVSPYLSETQNISTTGDNNIYNMPQPVV